MAGTFATKYQDVNPLMFAQGLYDTSTTKKVQIGQKLKLDDGREFMYVKAGAGALAPGLITHARVPLTTHTNMVVVSGALAATTVVFLSGAASAAAGDYAGGWLHVNDAAGEGNAPYKINTNAAWAASSTAASVTLLDEIRIALTTLSEVTITPPLGLGVIQLTSLAEAAMTSCPVGVTIVSMAAAEYGWIQTKGVCSVLAQGTLVYGVPVILSTAAGAVTFLTSDSRNKVVGTPVNINADSEYALINLDI